MELFLNLIFCSGILVQLILIIKDKKRYWLQELGICLALSIVLAGCGVLESGGSSGFFVMFFLFFPIMCAIWFRKEILPEISEATILIFSIVFWFLISIYLPECLYLPVIGIFLVSAALTLMLAFTDKKIEGNARAFLYVWFLFMALSIGLVQYVLNSQTNLLNWDSTDPFLAFFSGMSFFYLYAYGFYLFDFVPLPGKHQTMSNRLKEWRGYVEILNRKYSDTQLKPMHAGVMIIAAVGLLAINLTLDIVNDFLIIDLLLVGCQAMHLFRKHG